MRTLLNSQYKYEILNQQELLQYTDVIQQLLSKKNKSLIYPTSMSFTNYIQKDMNTNQILTIIEGLICPPVALVYTIISFDGKLLKHYKEMIDFFQVSDVYIYNNISDKTNKMLKYLGFTLYKIYPDLYVWYKKCR